MNVHIETYGCSANVNDSEIMAGILNRHGHRLVPSADDADAVIVNTCTVKGPTEDKIRSRLARLQAVDKHLVIAGCMAESQTDSVREQFPSAAVIGTHRIDRIADVVEGRLKLAVGRNYVNKSALPKVNLNNLIGIIQINTGCLGSCTFCITKLARGRTFSYPAGTIRNSVEEAVQNGCREMWLTSQDTGTYGLDRRTNIAELLQNLCSVEGDFFIRVGMMNPTLAGYLLKPLIKAFRSGKVFKFLHIPLQSGSNKVLRDMKRGYTAAAFIRIVDSFRKEIPGITVSTDVICGFPTETESDFNETLAAVEESMPDVVNVSRFWPRPGTEAAEMERLPDSVIMERSRTLHRLCKKIAMRKNRKWIGWKGRAVVDEIGRIEGTFVSRNFAYKPIVLASSENLMGKIVNVEVFGSAETWLKGRLVNDAVV